MEHRWNPRTPTDIKVILYHNRMPVINCKAINISAGGIFVNSKVMVYPRNTMLQVEFELPTEQGSEQFLMQTYVVFNSENGMGLIFLNTDSNLFRVLKYLTPPTNALIPQDLSLTRSRSMR